jgi:cell division septation protein DedD
VVVNPPAKARVNVKSTKVIPASTASLAEEEQAAPVAPKKQKVAVAAPTTTDESATSASGANGYVVVLASVPASGNSRLDALKKFADMQQQYGAVLANKTPDVRETTLAGKGAYHRLLVGPPSSRSQASELCTQLKASGYKDCWVTAY